MRTKIVSRAVLRECLLALAIWYVCLVIQGQSLIGAARTLWEYAEALGEYAGAAGQWLGPAVLIVAAGSGLCLIGLAALLLLASVCYGLTCIFCYVISLRWLRYFAANKGP